ncbi:hypothetical protein TNCV_4007911 [Trichonephila clavipes]|nr:hypothetical protein TNCV_4007911 [Trichonephila clavipes]
MVWTRACLWIGLRSQSHFRFGFDSDFRPSSSALPLRAPTEEGKGLVAGSRCQSIIVLVVAYDGLKAVTHHAEAKKHKECESAAAMSHRMKSFFTPKGSTQSEKVGIA